MGAFRIFSRLAELLDITSYDLPANNTPLSNALDAKAPVSTTVTTDTVQNVTATKVFTNAAFKSGTFSGTIFGDDETLTANRAYVPPNASGFIALTPNSDGTPALSNVTGLGTNVATALAIAADATGGIFRQGQALSATTVTASGAVSVSGGGSISGSSGAVTIAASGANQNITLTPSGTGGIASGGTPNGFEKMRIETAHGYFSIRNDNPIQFQLRPNSGKNGWFAFTENGVADRWLIGITTGSDLLRFRRDSIAGTDMLTLSNAGLLSAVNLAASGTVKTGSQTAAVAIASSHATAVAAGDRAQTYISDTDKPAWSDGTVWKYADGTTVT